jgi:hypothetical protein
VAEYDIFGGPSGQPAVGIGSELYVPTGMGLLVALPDSQSQAEFREWDLGASVLVDTAGRLYFGGDSAYDRFGIFRTGEQPGPDPIVYVDDVILGAPGIGPDGTIYIGSRDGYLYALKGNAPLAGTIWPKYAHDARNTGCAAGH